MKRITIGIVALALLLPGVVFAQVITFDNTASPGDATGYGGDPVVFGAFTFTATGGTSQYSLDPAYDASNAPPNNTDFETFENGPVTWTMSSPAPFQLSSFRGAAIYDNGAGTLTVTGNLNGGGTVVQVFNIPSGNPNAQWATYVLNAGFTNLTSVDFDWSDQYFGLDDVVINGASVAGTGTPVPTQSELGTALLALAIAAAAALALRRRPATSRR